MSLCQERTVFDALLSFNVANGQIQVISSLAKVYRTFQNKKNPQYRFRLCLLLIDDLTFFFSHSHILYDTNSPPVFWVALFNEWHVVWSLYMFK